MKKLKLVGMLAAVVMLMFIVVASYLSEKNVDEPEELFVVPVNRDELFISSKEGYNSIEIYKQENKLVINAQSEAAFFDGVQFTVEIEGEIAQEDVEIIWMTIGGNTEYVEGNDRIIAEIKISDNDELICDRLFLTCCCGSTGAINRRSTKQQSTERYSAIDEYRRGLYFRG